MLAMDLLGLMQTNRRLKRELTGSFEEHPDQHIFTSLPGAGELLAPSLLAKFGDDRARFSDSGKRCRRWLGHVRLQTKVGRNGLLSSGGNVTKSFGR